MNERHNRLLLRLLEIAKSGKEADKHLRCYYYTIIMKKLLELPAEYEGSGNSVILEITRILREY